MSSCYALVDSPSMAPNKSQHVVVSKCDNGPLIFQVEKNRQLYWSRKILLKRTQQQTN